MDYNQLIDNALILAGRKSDQYVKEMGIKRLYIVKNINVGK